MPTELTSSAPLTADSLIVEAEARIDWNALRAFYRERGVKCFMCAAAEVETFEQGARIHHFDADEVLRGLNELAAHKPFRAPPPGALRRFGAWLSGKLQDKGVGPDNTASPGNSGGGAAK